jgi:DNA invertase Pin-like site-specific DNA recombinase
MFDHSTKIELGLLGNSEHDKMQEVSAQPTGASPKTPKPQNPLPKKAVIYCRVSSGNQDKQTAVSSDVQERVCRDFIHDNKLRLASVHKETKSAYHGKRTMLRELIIGNPNTTIVVYDVSRFTRNIETGHELLRLASENGVRFAFATHGMVSGGEGGEGADLIALMTQAQQESENIGRRVRDALKRKRDEGFHTGGRVPYGFDKEATPHGQKLIINDAEMEVVDFINYCFGGGAMATRLNSMMQSMSPLWDAAAPICCYSKSGKVIAQLTEPMDVADIAALLNDYEVTHRGVVWTKARILAVLKRHADRALEMMLGEFSIGEGIPMAEVADVQMADAFEAHDEKDVEDDVDEEDEEDDEEINIMDSSSDELPLQKYPVPKPKAANPVKKQTPVPVAIPDQSERLKNQMFTILLKKRRMQPRDLMDDDEDSSSSSSDSSSSIYD